MDRAKKPGLALIRKSADQAVVSFENFVLNIILARRMSAAESGAIV
jgi:hypothetical protein